MSVVVRCALRTGPRLRVDVVRDLLSRITREVGFPDHDLGLLVTTNATIARYNQELLGKKGPTDVISIPGVLDFVAPKKTLNKDFPPEHRLQDLGDIIVSVAYVEQRAAQVKKSLSSHFTHLMVHSVLHLVGYDHDNDADWALMDAEEKRVLKAIGWRKLFD